MEPGTSAVCVREVQKSLLQSSKRLIENKIRDLEVGKQFEVLHDRIKTPGDGLIIFQGMQDSTAESVKSLEGFKIAWIEEAQTLSARSLALLRPTIRAAQSEIWANWNPRRKSDAIDDFFRAKKPDNAIVVRANWRDNPWFPAELEAERQLDLKVYPERYEHIWEGDYAKAFEGAYFAQGLAQARAQGRIGRVAADPLLPVLAFIDIGGSGAKADAMAIWIAQFVAREIRLLHYIEGVGQPLGYYAAELRRLGYEKAVIKSPHDGVNANNVTGKRYVDHWREAGFDADEPIPNQGPGAAMMRVEAVRRILPRCWFNEATTEPGRDALGYYHERKDEFRNVGLGPEHDWSSHCFVGETKILTRNGTCQIKHLPIHGDVLTPCGWKPYRNPRVTRTNARLVEVEFTDGLTVRCTPDHLFLTASGWKSAECLTRDLPIRSTLTRQRRISMASYIVAGRVKSIGRVVAEHFIGTFCGIAGMPNERRAGQNGSVKLGFALCAIQSLKRLLEKADIHRFIAAPIVRLLHGAQKLQRGVRGEKRVIRLFEKNSALIGANIVSVRKLNETADVWCLTVPDVECFSLANGAVVHNCCDSFGLMAICYEEPQVKQEKRRERPQRSAWVA